MTTLNENLADHFAGLAANIGFQLALVPENETVRTIKLIHAGFCETYESIFPGSGSEGHQLAKSIITAALCERHELERFGSPVISRSIH